MEWDDLGHAVRFFRPDFYLPDQDLFIEITTMNQKLVTKKNRKIRRLRTLYPGVKCKIFYQRDYLNLLVKYGIEEATTNAHTQIPKRIPGPPHVIDLGSESAAG